MLHRIGFFMNQTSSLLSRRVNVIGAGPAGLMAAEVLARAGVKVQVFDAMASVGRKFLLAGIGGMNITHNEAWATFLTRYSAAPVFIDWLNRFDNRALIEWIHGLGIETFVGSSNRVFPKDMKAAPLLRAWLTRLRELGVEFHPRHRFVGFTDAGQLQLASPTGQITVAGDATVLALGGGSWARLGSDGSWVAGLTARGVQVAPLVPSNCGFIAPVAAKLADQHGQPVHQVGLSLGSRQITKTEIILSAYGLEGTGIYALSGAIRDAITSAGSATLRLDLLPDIALPELTRRLAQPRGKNSLSNFLRKQTKLTPVKLALLRALTPKDLGQDPAALAHAIKQLPVQLTDWRPIDEAISTAGGISFAALDAAGQLRALPGVFAAGEMLDWDAPTGGYLLTGCFASGRAVGEGVLKYLRAQG